MVGNGNNSNWELELTSAVLIAHNLDRNETRG